MTDWRFALNVVQALVVVLSVATNSSFGHDTRGLQARVEICNRDDLKVCPHVSPPRVNRPISGDTEITLVNEPRDSRVLVFADGEEIGDGGGGSVSLTRPVRYGETLVVVRQLGDCRSEDGYITTALPPLDAGYTECRPGAVDCSVCVDSLARQLGAIDEPGRQPLDIRRANWEWRFEDFIDGAYGKGNHNQGVARLADTVIDGRLMGRMVMTANSNDKPPRGFYLGLQSIGGAREGVFSADQYHDHVRSFQIVNVDAWGRHDHPGGIQAHGDTVVVAVEKHCREMDGDMRLTGNDCHLAGDHGALYFLRVNGARIRFVQALQVDGSRGEPFQAFQAAAATAGFVKLRSGHFLLAVSGRNHGLQGIWFYVSKDTELRADTEWEYVSFYEPSCKGYGAVGDECYAGAGGGLNLVADCSGEIYLLAMHGNDGIGKNSEYLQAFRVGYSVAEEKVTLSKVWQQRDRFRLATRKSSFRWASGVYVTQDGGLIVMSAKRKTRLGKDNTGHVYIDAEYLP